MADDTITELEELGAEKVSGVGSPANGTPWLLLKADTATTAERPQKKTGEVKDMEDITKAEADEIEAMLTKARFQGFCETENCGVCKERFGPLHEDLVEKAKLTAADRKKLPKSAFVFPDKAPDSGCYPIHDEAHARNALARSSGKPEESKVTEEVARRYPKMVGKAGPGNPATATAEPKAAGLITSEAKLAGPMTTVIRGDHANPAFAEAGEPSYEIPLEDSERTNLQAPPQPDRPAEILVAANQVGKDSWTIEVVEKQNWVSTDKGAAEAPPAPSGDESTTPGDSAWQAYDSETCDSVARGLAGALQALEAIRTREVTEAVSGNSSEWMDAFQLSCAADDICSALSLVAALAYREAASGDSQAATKSTAAVQSLLSMFSPEAGFTTPITANGGRTSEEEINMATITKEELSAEIASVATKAVTDALTAQKKADQKAAKKAAAKKAKARKAKAKIKAKMKGIPFADGDAEKVSNNKGDLDAGSIKPKSRATQTSPGAAAGTVDAKYKNKTKKSKAEKELLKAAEMIQKMAQRPRTGGPVLDGQARGMFPAGEARTGDVAKGAGDEVTVLADRLEKSSDPMERDQISRELTLARLRAGHEAGLI